MSDRDSFINEVSEEVRRDRMYGLWRRYGPFVIGLVVFAVLAAGVKTWLDARAVDEARRVGGEMIAAGEAAPGEAAAALTALADETGADGAATLARLRAAGLHAAEGDLEAAARAYDAVAADGDADPILQDFAAYRAIMARAGGMAPQQLADALTPIAEGSGAFRLLGLEAKGYALLQAGDQDAAVEMLRQAGSDPDAPQGLRQRVDAVLTSLGVDPATAPGESAAG